MYSSDTEDMRHKFKYEIHGNLSLASSNPKFDSNDPEDALDYIKQLSSNENDIIYIYEYDSTFQIGIELLENHSYIVEMMLRARHRKEMDINELELLFINFNEVLNDPCNFGFSEENIY